MLKEVKGKKKVLEAYLAGVPIMRIVEKEDEKQLNFGIAMDMTKILDAELKERYRFLIDVDETEKPSRTRKAVPMDKPERKKTAKDKAPDEEEAGEEKERIDEGKIKALHEAKWTNKQIADEMRISEGTVRKCLKKLHGEKKTSDPDEPRVAS